MNSGHRDYPGSGHPEVNSPTSCFDCIISLSGVVTVWWKKVQRELNSTCPSSLLPSDPFRNRIPSPWSTACLFYRGGEACRRSLALCPRCQRNLQSPLLAPDGSLVTGDAPRPARPACSGRGGVARRLSCPVRAHVPL